MDPFIGEIRMVGFNFAPTGWAQCDGQLLPISAYQALFALIGTTYGGNGTTNFALPDLRSRVAIHQGQGNGLSPYSMGQTGGTENVSLNTTQMPAHNHTMAINNTSGNLNDPTGTILAVGNNGDSRAPQQFPDFTKVAATGTLAANAISTVGGGGPHPNIQPYQVVNFIIALQGIFPTRP